MISPAHYAHPVTTRCFGTGIDVYEAYHDTEWGRPVTADRELFEHFCLEAFQAGLSWLTILRKRDAFRSAFADFEPSAVARFGQADVERLLQDAGIVRNRAKIEAVIANACAVMRLRGDGGNFSELVWAHRPHRHKRPRSLTDLPAHTPESGKLAGALRGLGFRFLGPTTAYAAMQACGLVNDHLVGCPTGAEVARSGRSVVT